MEFQVYKTRRALETGGDDGLTALSMYLIPANAHLKMTKVVNFMLCVF